MTITDWISVATPPLADRPGEYDVAFSARWHTNGVMVIRMRWTGREWVEGPSGWYYGNPVAGFGDKWRGVTKP